MAIKLIPLGYVKSLPNFFFESNCRNIENNKEKNPQIDHVEETVSVKWRVSNVFKYNDLRLSKRINSGSFFSKTFHVVSNIRW